MAFVVYLVMFLAFTGHSSATFCICRDGIAESSLQKTLDYACGAGADCTPILQNGGCFNPNTVKDHCNYAVNSYFQKKGQSAQACDFAGTAVTSPTAPSNVASTCSFPSSASSSTTPTTTPTTGTGVTPSTTTTGSTTGSTTGTTTGSTSPVFNGLGPTGSGTLDGSLAPYQTTNWLFTFLISMCLVVGLFRD